jgi:hypothetical protein
VADDGTHFHIDGHRDLVCYQEGYNSAHEEILEKQRKIQDLLDQRRWTESELDTARGRIAELVQERDRALAELNSACTAVDDSDVEQVLALTSEAFAAVAEREAHKVGQPEHDDPPADCQHEHVDRGDKCWDCGAVLDVAIAIIKRRDHGTYTPSTLLAMMAAEKDLDPVAAVALTELEAEGAIELVPAEQPEPTCNCSQEHWQNTRRFTAQERNEGHEFACPMFLKGAHFFPLPASGTGDGSGDPITVTCVWCGETKEQRPFEPQVFNGPQAAGGPAARLKAKRDSIVFPTEHTEEEYAAARAARHCVDCEAGTTGLGNRCQVCGGRNSAALRKLTGAPA